MTASIDDLWKIYDDKSFKKQFKTVVFKDAELVTEDDIINDEDAALKKIQYQITHPLVVSLTEPIPQMGALGKKLAIFPVYSHGNKSFVYTRGFTGIGGKEFILYGIHRSMNYIVSEVFNNMYQRHLQGHPAGHGHTLSCGNLTLMATEPTDEKEATLVKASKLLNCNRVYGLTAYDILIVKPFALGRGQDGVQPSGVEVMMARLGIHNEDSDLQLISSSADLESCAWCHDTFENTKLLMCKGCKNSFYCCPHHQKLHWKQSHKKDCAKLKRSYDPEDFVSTMVDMVQEVSVAEMEQHAEATAASAAVPAAAAEKAEHVEKN